MTYLVVLAVVLAVVRLVWFGDFLRRCRATGHWLEKVRTLTTTTLEGGKPDDHTASVSLSNRQLDTSLVGGSVALAAWTQLFVSSEAPPGARISGVSLGLLFTGAFVLVLCPVLFRTGGLHLTYLGRESGTHVGFGIVLLSLCGFAHDLVPHAVVGVPVALLACAIVARDAAEVWQHLVLHKGYNF